MSESLFIEIDLPFYALIVADSKETAVQSYMDELQNEGTMTTEMLYENAQSITKEDAFKKFLSQEVPFDAQQAFKNLNNGEIVIYDEELIEKWSKTI